MPTLVHGRIEALLVALTGMGDNPEHVDVGPWKWTYRGDNLGHVATWRHEKDWSRTVVIRPITVASVVVEYPDGSHDGSFSDEGEAIETAIDWMKDNGELQEENIDG